MPGLFEHALFLVILLAFPLWGVVEHRRLCARYAAGDPDARVNAYRLIMATEWAFAAVVVVRWSMAGTVRDMLGAGDVGAALWWTGWALAIAGSVASTLQTVGILHSSEAMAKVRGQLEPMRTVIPTTDREARVFNGLAFTAGTCEEVIYRGFVLVYLSAFVDPWIAVVGASVVFGLGHAYQGWANILKTGLVGAIMAGLYLFTDSLWPPMLLHIVIDVNGGYLGRKVLAQAPANAPPGG